MGSEHKFQVDLRGVIDLLSNHLYSGPQVYIRELLQNSVDAIVARQQEDPTHVGHVSFELVQPGKNKTATLIVHDNGVGLTEEEVHRFLATIGQSSKRESLAREDFIGQFGIGLLSGFLVSSEIVVITRSVRDGSPAVKWTGRTDGTYELEVLDGDFAAGTQVFLTSKPGSEDFFDASFVRGTATHFGALLPITVEISAGGTKEPINEDPPWRTGYPNEKLRREAMLDYGKELFEVDFLDAVPLKSEVGGVEGIAYILPHTANLTAKRTHRVYLKNMLLSEQAELLPDWAFFVRCVVNATDLRPTASREAFHEDEHLAEARDVLGQCLREYLMNLAQTDRERMDAIVALHYLPIKALALEDDDFFRLFVDWLPFETSLGRMSLAEILEHEKVIRYVSTRDQFRQISAVAAAQGMCIVNAGYVYDTELIERLPDVMPQRRIERVDVSDLAQEFDELTLDERESLIDFLKLLDVVLQPYRCEGEMKRFQPAELPTLYTTNAEANFLRSVEQTKDVADDLWSGVLDNVSREALSSAVAQLCLNYENPLVQRLTQVKDRNLIRRVVELLYVQALLMGHFPLRGQEMKALNEGLLALIEMAVDSQAG